MGVLLQRPALQHLFSGLGSPADQVAQFRVSAGGISSDSQHADRICDMYVEGRAPRLEGCVLV